MAEAESMVQRAEKPECQEKEEIDIGRYSDGSEPVLRNHFVLDLLPGQTDQKSRRNDHEITDHGNEPAVVIDHCEDRRLAEKVVENLVEPHHQGNQEQKPPANPVAGMRHQDTFLLHDVRFNVSVTKVSIFFKMPNKLGKKNRCFGDI